MAVRIQLASNFQVIELTYDDWESVNTDELKDATNLVNELGAKVKNDIKTAPKSSKKEKESKKDEKASEKQLKFAYSLGLSEEEAEDMSKREVWEWIQANK